MLRKIMLISVLILLIGCSSDEAITIAGLLPLTGDYALYGIEEADAIRMFIEEWNKNNELKMNYVLQDTESKPKVAVDGMQRLLTKNPKLKNKAPDLIVITPAPSSLAIQPIANENKILTVAIDVSRELANGYMIQNWPSNEDYARNIVEEMKIHQRLGLIYRNDELGISVKEAIINSFNGTIFTEKVDPSTIDFRTNVAKLKVKDVDAIFLIGGGKTLGLAIKQIREQMGDVPIYSGPEISYPDVQETAGQYYYGIKYVDFDFDYSKGQMKDLRDKFFAKYGREPAPDVPVVYDALELFTACIPYQNRETLLNCVKAKQVQGLTGQVKIENNAIDYSELLKIQSI